jgi:DNA polymerase-3 subunit gamma/tau
VESDSSQLVSKTLPKESFSFDQVKMVWRQFAFETKNKGMETFYSAMVKRDPKVIDDVILLMSVDNQIQIDYITPHLQDLNGFLRKELKNYDVSVEMKLSEHQESEVKFLTGKDKFAAMARKNPNIHSLKTIFNLDIEY